MTDLQSTLDAIDEVAVHRCGQCDAVLRPEAPSDEFCSEACQAAWNVGIKGTLAEFIIEWRHPYDGDFQEPLCESHTREVRGALHILGIGYAGMNVPEPTACCRCLDDRSPSCRRSRERAA